MDDDAMHWNTRKACKGGKIEICEPHRYEQLSILITHVFFLLQVTQSEVLIEPIQFLRWLLVCENGSIYDIGTSQIRGEL